MKSNPSFSRIRGKTPDPVLLNTSTSPPARLSHAIRPSINYTATSTRTPRSIKLATLYTPTHHIEQVPLFRLSHRDIATMDTRHTEVSSSRHNTLESERRTNATLLAEIQKLEALLKENRQSDQNWNQKQTELESRIKVLVDENERLRDLIDQYASENQNLKNAIQGLTHDPEAFTDLEKKNRELQYEVERLNEALALRLKEINTFRSKASVDVGVLSARKSARPRESIRRVNNENRITEFEEERKELEEVENKAINAINKQARDLQSWQVAYKKLEAKLNAVLLENSKLKENQDPNVQEVLLLRTQFIDMQDRLKGKKELETRLQLVLLECDVLKGKIEELTGEREVQQRRIMEFEDLHPDAKELEDRIILLIGENEKLNRALIENQNREETLRVFEGQELENERRRLAHRIEELEEVAKSTWELKDKVILLADDNERLLALEQEKNAQIELLAKNLIESQERCQELAEMQEKIDIIIAENENLSKIAAMKDIELNEYGMQHIEREQTNAMLETDLQHAREEILELRSDLRTVSEQLEKMNLLVREKDKTVKEGEKVRLEVNAILAEKEGLEEKVELLINENDRLQALLGDRTKEIEHLKIECVNLQANSASLNQRCEQLQFEKNEIEGKIELLIAENMNVNHSAFDKMKQNEEWKAKYYSLQAEHSHLANIVEEFEKISQENEYLKKLLSEKQGIEAELEALTLENERLINATAENFESLERWEAKYYELEREYNSFNGLENDMVNKLRLFEDKIKMLVNDNTNLGSIISEKSMQYEELKAKYNNLENEYIHLRNTENLVIVEKERLTERIRLLEKERTQLSHTVVDKIKQAENWENEYYKNEAKRESLKDWERDFALLKQEADRTKESLYEKSLEVEGLKETIIAQNIKLGALPELEGKIILLATENQRLEEEIKEIVHKYEEVQWTNNRLTIQINEGEGLRDKVRLLSTEAQRNANQLEDARQKNSGIVVYQIEIEDLRRKLDAVNMEKERSEQRLTDLTHHIEELELRNIQLEAQKTELRASNEILELPKIEPEKKKAGGADFVLENRVTILADENERLKTQLRTVSQELEQTKWNINNTKNQQKAGSEDFALENRRTILADENERLKTQLKALSQELEQAKWNNNNSRNQQNEIDDLKIKLARVSKGNEELEYRLRSITHEFDDLKWKNNELEHGEIELEELKRKIQIISAEKERVHQNLDDLHQQNNEWMSKYFGLQKENNELHVQVGAINQEKRYLESSNLQLTNEVQELRSTVVQLEENRVKTELIEKEVNSILKDNENLHKELEEKVREIEQNRLYINQLVVREGENLELKSRVQSLREDNERLDRQVKDLSKEVYTWKNRYEEIQRKQPNLVELDRKIDALGNECQRVNRELAEKVARIAELEKKEIELAALKNQEQWKNSENQLLTTTIREMREELRVWKEKGTLFDKNQPMITELERKLDQLISENKRLAQEILEKPKIIVNPKEDKNEIAFQDMKNHMQRLVSEKEKLEVLVLELRQEIMKLKERPNPPVYVQTEHTVHSMSPVNPLQSTYPVHNEHTLRSVNPATSVHSVSPVYNERSVSPERHVNPKQFLSPTQTSHPLYPEHNVRSVNSIPPVPDEPTVRSPERSVSPKHSWRSGNPTPSAHSMNPGQTVSPVYNESTVRSVSPERYVNPVQFLSPGQTAHPLYPEHNVRSVNPMPVQTTHTPHTVRSVNPVPTQITHTPHNVHNVHSASPSLDPYQSHSDMESKLDQLLKENRRLVQVVDDNNQYIQSLNQELEVRPSPIKSSPERTTTIIRNSEPGLGKFGTTGNITYKIEGDSEEEEEAESGQEFDVDGLDEEDKIGLLVEEIEKLQRKVDKRNKIIEAYRIQFGNSEEGMASKLILLSTEVERLTQMVNEKDREIQTLGRGPINLGEMKDLIKELESIILILKRENEALIQEVQSKNKEIETLKLSKGSLSSDDKHLPMIYLLQAKIVLLCAEIERLSNELDKVKNKTEQNNFV